MNYEAIDNKFINDDGDDNYDDNNDDDINKYDKSIDNVHVTIGVEKYRITKKSIKDVCEWLKACENCEMEYGSFLKQSLLSSVDQISFVV